jgi:hypothetical protein
MRTPGSDVALAAGFLFGEAIVQRAEDILRIETCATDEGGQAATVHLARGAVFDPRTLERHFYTTSSCGVCGKASIEAVLAAGVPTVEPGEPVPAELLLAPPRAAAGAPGALRAYRRAARGCPLRPRGDPARHPRGRRASQRHGQAGGRGAPGWRASPHWTRSLMVSGRPQLRAGAEGGAGRGGGAGGGLGAVQPGGGAGRAGRDDAGRVPEGGSLQRVLRIGRIRGDERAAGGLSG